MQWREKTWWSWLFKVSNFVTLQTSTLFEVHGYFPVVYKILGLPQEDEQLLLASSTTTTTFTSTQARLSLCLIIDKSTLLPQWETANCWQVPGKPTQPKTKCTNLTPAWRSNHPPALEVKGKLWYFWVAALKFYCSNGSFLPPNKPP